MFDLVSYIIQTQELKHVQREAQIGNVSYASSAASVDVLENPVVIHLPDGGSDGQANNVQKINTQTNNVQQPNAQRKDRKINYLYIGYFLLLYVIGFVLVIYGSRHFHDCPAQKLIPMYVIFMGVVHLLSRAVSTPQDMYNICNKEYTAPKSIIVPLAKALLQFGFFFFFFITCGLIFSMNPPVVAPDEQNYCKESFYKVIYNGCIGGLGLSGLILCFQVYRMCKIKICRK